MSDHAHPVDAERVAIARQAALTAARAVRASEILSTLGDPLRLRILSGLVDAEELCVGDLALAFEASEDAVSYALRQLRVTGLVVSRREGRLRCHRLAPSVGASTQDVLAALEPMLEVDLGDRAR